MLTIHFSHIPLDLNTEEGHFEDTDLSCLLTEVQLQARKHPHSSIDCVPVLFAHSPASGPAAMAIAGAMPVHRPSSSLKFVESLINTVQICGPALARLNHSPKTGLQRLQEVTAPSNAQARMQGVSHRIRHTRVCQKKPKLYEWLDN
jgi:hypothetical protein